MVSSCSRYTENDIVAIVSEHLKKEGFSISQKLSTMQHGIDVIARSPDGKNCYIEAKGGTSSKPTTNRFGKPFTRNQANSHFSVALLKCMQLIQKFSDEKPIIGIALPKDQNHFQIFESIRSSLKVLNIRLYFVGDDENVEEIN